MLSPGLGAIHAVCRARQPFDAFPPWALFRQIPGFPHQLSPWEALLYVREIYVRNI